MKKSILLFLALLFIVPFTHAQDVKVELSPEFKLPKRKSFQGHLYSDPTGHYVYFYDASSRGYSVLLEKYSPEFKLLYGKAFTSDVKNLSSMGMEYLKGQFALMLYERNNRDDYLKFSAIPISLEGKAKKAVTIAKMRYERKRDIPSTRWMISQDTTKLLFTAYSDNNKDDIRMDMFLSVLDKEFNTLWDKQFKLGYSEEQVNIRNWAVSDEGTVYALAKIYDTNKARETKKTKGKRVANYRMVVLQFKEGDDKPSEFELNLNDAFVKSATVRINPQGDLTALGFYANDFKGLVQGAFLMKMDAESGKIKIAKKKEFSQRDLAFMGDDNTKKKKGEEGLESQFSFRDVIFLEDGSTLMTAEENYSVTYTVRTGRTYSTRTVYYSKDIIVINFDAEGSLQTVRMIPKRQKSGASTFFQSYTALPGKGKAYFFYNDDKKNLKKPLGEKTNYTSNFNDAVTVMTSVDDNGKMERTPLFKGKDVESLFIPQRSSAIDENSLFFVTMKPKMLGKSDFRMGTINLE
jgi:hypothetical protein